MGTSIYFPLSAVLFSILLLISFFGKKHLKTEETKIFGHLIITNFCGLIIELLCTYAAYIYDSNKVLADIILKSYLIYLITWCVLFTVYIFYISYKNRPDRNAKIMFVIIYFLIVFTLLILPINLVVKNNFTVRYTEGLSVNFTYMVSFILILFMLTCMIKNYKNLKSKKYLPLFLFLILGTFCTLIQMTHPSILLMTYIETFIMYTMYFTIENPDVKMLEELYKNKKLIESNNEDTSNFIFKITQDIKKPVDDIIRISSNTNEEKLKEINNISKNLNYLIDDALDISSMTSDNLKVYNTKYNPANLFKSLKEKYENKLTKNVKLDFTISETIPNCVYGDSIKLKQIIGSILQNSIDHTTIGVITFEIDAIIKYGICRFIINITDNGEGISIDKVNDILSLKELDYEIDLNKEILNLREAKILLNKIGGAFMIKSDDNKTNVSIIVNQKIVETSENKKDKELDLYQQKIIKSKKIMVVDDDSKELKLIKEHLENNNIDVSSSLYGKDVIEKIKNNYKFDLIVLDDETNTDSAYEVLKELKKDKEFKTKVVIMINDDKKVIKKHYIEDGFIDIILKSDLKNELDRIISKI